MLIHEITLREATRVPVTTGLAQRAQQRNVGVGPVTQTGTPVAQPAGANAFGQIAQQLAPQTPPGPSTSSSGGTIKPTTQGVTHTANIDNPNQLVGHPETAKMQQQWDLVNQQLRKQNPGQSEQQYQQAMLKKMGYARPGVLKPATAPATTKPTTQPARPIAKMAPAATSPVAPTLASATPKARPAAPVAAPAITQYPPITLGSGPKAQVFVNKGRGYIDSKTGKPMPPSIVKAMGV